MLQFALCIRRFRFFLPASALFSVILSAPHWDAWSNQRPETENGYYQEELLPRALHQNRKQSVERAQAFSAKISGCPTLSPTGKDTSRAQCRLEIEMIHDPIPHEGYLLSPHDRGHHDYCHCDSLPATRGILICGLAHRRELPCQEKEHGHTVHEIYHLRWVCSYYSAYSLFHPLDCIRTCCSSHRPNIIIVYSVSSHLYRK